ncbi:DNA repair protein [Leucogyrophana mollusca]|uniref:DNA repair protein n=1 Tax=Leucogyrophana mollusca TaxID=85980 RepID=A0ACB8BRH3_9AGAM|nr:DNA repair protein [Leucogyrophana mollusca]
MAKPLKPSGSSSSDLFGPDDPELMEILQTAVLSGDEPIERLPIATTVHSTVDTASRKRSRSFSPKLSSSSLPGATQAKDSDSVDDDTAVYGASRFGQFGEYMRRKRAKLQIQNENLDINDDAEGKSRIFQGLSIYINGFTTPSVQDLRQLIVKHGGVFQPYLDKKSLVPFRTHILTCSLTAAKIRDFKHMKVARPEWLVESAAAGTLLPWRDYIFRPGGRVEASQGISTQRPLFELPPLLPKPTAGAAKEAPLVDTSTQDLNVPRTPAGQQDDFVTQQMPPTASTSRLPLEISPSRVLYMTDPATYEEAARIPGYAANKSNPLAERVMANPDWRAAHTSAAPDFIEGFYKNSRLHHLSTWKAELKNLVAQAQEHVEGGEAAVLPPGREPIISASDSIWGHGGEVAADGEEDVSMKGAELVMQTRSKGKGKERAVDPEKVIMHCDFDCFFVSAGLISRPHLRGKPVVVCHSQGAQGGAASTSEIASSSYEARVFGIKNGMSLQQARKLCPGIMTIPYEFETYRQISLQFYTILMRHADDLQAVSVDEALIEVTSSVARRREEYSRLPVSEAAPKDPAQDLADLIRFQVKEATGCEVSIGIAENIQLARIATRRAKPAGTFHLVAADVQKVLEPLDIDDLHGFGYSTRQKAKEKLGATNLGELLKKSKGALCDALGKGTGETLYKAMRGIDERRLESDKPRKSVSCDINYGIRFENNEQAEAFIFQMAEEVSRRLNNVDMRGRSLTLKIMKRDPSAPVEPPKFMGHGICETFNKQTPLSNPQGRATSDNKDIGEHAWRLLKSWNFDPKELRGIGIQIQKLESTSGGDHYDPGQAKLPFQLLDTPTKARKGTAEADITDDHPEALNIDVEPPSQEAVVLVDTAGPINDGSNFRNSPSLDLPSFSQVDKEVFDALPADLRKELELEYQRRSHSPVPPEPSPVVPDARPKILVKGVNVKRITQQLAPNNRTMLSPKKNMLFTKRVGTSGMRTTDAELRKLDIDPEVFALLPIELQREQLITARHLKSGGLLSKRKIIKDGTRQTRSPSFPYRKKPPPQAKHPQPPLLKQQGKEKGERLYFTETDDVQRVIESWVEGFQEYPPNQRDVDYFSKFLVQSVDSADSGMEKTIAVMKWWLVLLRRDWTIWEHETSDVDKAKRLTSEGIGKAWWRAFREVKGKVDVAARKRFGGSLSLK